MYIYVYLEMLARKLTFIEKYKNIYLKISKLLKLRILNNTLHFL